MNDEAAFLAAIAASPKDELQYLVFADWLPVSPVRNLGRTGETGSDISGRLRCSHWSIGPICL